MKYVKKPVVIEAEQYKKGMEDGFSCMPYVLACTRQDTDGNYKQCGTCNKDTVKKPYISGSGFFEFIEDGNYIITDDGCKYVCTKERFEKTYDPFKPAPTNCTIIVGNEHLNPIYWNVNGQTVDMCAVGCDKCQNTACLDTDLRDLRRRD